MECWKDHSWWGKACNLSSRHRSRFENTSELPLLYQKGAPNAVIAHETSKITYPLSNYCPISYILESWKLLVCSVNFGIVCLWVEVVPFVFLYEVFQVCFLSTSKQDAVDGMRFPALTDLHCICLLAPTWHVYISYKCVYLISLWLWTFSIKKKQKALQSIFYSIKV